MDVSGSMTDEQKEIVRTEAFWIDTWLEKQYKGVETSLHHPRRRARRRSTNTFYHTRESGGTRISSAYKPGGRDHRSGVPRRRVEHLLLPVLRRRQLGRRQPHSAFEAARRERCCRASNLFCYGQVESPYGSGDFMRRSRKTPRRPRERWCSSEIDGQGRDL